VPPLLRRCTNWAESTSETNRVMTKGATIQKSQHTNKILGILVGKLEDGGGQRLGGWFRQFQRSLPAHVSDRFLQLSSIQIGKVPAVVAAGRADIQDILVSVAAFQQFWHVGCQVIL